MLTSILWILAKPSTTALNNLPMPKLYEIPRKSTIIADIQEGDKEYKDAKITFHHLDGAYSYCTVNDSGTPVHISASAELRKLEDGTYKLD